MERDFVGIHLTVDENCVHFSSLLLESLLKNQYSESNRAPTSLFKLLPSFLLFRLPFYFILPSVAPALHLPYCRQAKWQD